VQAVACQAEQPLCPILELLDHRDVLGRWPSPEAPAEWGRLVAATWYALPRDDATGMLRSEENPADDASDLPLLLSTEVLHWSAAQRLAIHAVELGLGTRSAELDAEAAAVRSAVTGGFTVDGPFGRQWAYAIDASGGQCLYHDANDLPVALAPLVGFVTPDDKTWQATMRFAFSPHNPAFVPGAGGGLGSLHTPGVWPLGDVQEWVWASIAGDDARVDRVLSRLAVVHRHGMLPETYDPVSAEWRSRRWFAWPGAAIAALVAGAFG
jgi:meiotically up-regulated gene 157 (Mug157) protein